MSNSSAKNLYTNRNVDIDDPESLLLSKEIILSKPFLKSLYLDWYQGYLSAAATAPEGIALEIGSGGGFLQDVAPQVLTSDVIPCEFCDLAFSGEEMPFAASSVSSIFMLNVFHHIPDCGRFLQEAERVLVAGGLVYILDPANTVFSRLIYKNLHHELFDENLGWSFPGSGPLSGSNQALSWIVFNRDREQFSQRFPGLEIESIELHTPTRYLLSGGLSHHFPIPGWSFSAWTKFEQVMTPLNRWLALFNTVILRRIAN